MNNIDKILQYLQVVTKYPIEVDGNIIDKGIRRIRLSNSFFLTDSCNSCGCCDVPESNVYTTSEYQKIMTITEPEYHAYNSALDMKQLDRLRNGLREEVHTINGKDISVYVFDLEKQYVYVPQKEKECDRCTWMFPAGDVAGYHFYCHIHPVTSITCKMPHLRFLYNKRSDIARLGIYQFGRNWATKCPVVFSEPETEEQFEINRRNRIEKLTILNQCAKDMNIDTYLNNIIEYIESVEYDHYADFLEKDIINTLPKSKKLI